LGPGTGLPVQRYPPSTFFFLWRTQTPPGVWAICRGSDPVQSPLDTVSQCVASDAIFVFFPTVFPLRGNACEKAEWCQLFLQTLDPLSPRHVLANFFFSIPPDGSLRRLPQEQLDEPRELHKARPRYTDPLARGNVAIFPLLDRPRRYGTLPLDRGPEFWTFLFWVFFLRPRSRPTCLSCFLVM